MDGRSGAGKRAAWPTTSVLLIGVDADANHTAIISTVTIAAVISAVVVDVARRLHPDFLEVVADERESIRNGRPVLDERERAREGSAAARSGGSRRPLRAGVAFGTLRTRHTGRTRRTHCAHCAGQTLRTCRTLRARCTGSAGNTCGACRTLCTRVAFRALCAGCTGRTLRTLRARCSRVTLRPL